MSDRAAIAMATSRFDFYKTMLRKSIECLSKETVATWLEDCVNTIHATESESIDRIEANAMLVAVLGQMLETINDNKESA